MSSRASIWMVSARARAARTSSGVADLFHGGELGTAQPHRHDRRHFPHRAGLSGKLIEVRFQGAPFVPCVVVVHVPTSHAVIGRIRPAP